MTMKDQAPVGVSIADVVGPLSPGGLNKLVQVLLALDYPVRDLEPEEILLLPADPVLVAQLLELGVVFDLAQTEVDGKPVTVSDILTNAEGQHRVECSTGLKADEDLTNAFSPDETARRARPADLKTDELGVLERLRIHQRVSENAARQLAKGNIATDLDGLRTEIDTEAEQLQIDLKKLRVAQKALLEQRIKTIESRLEIAKQNLVPSHEIQADAEFRKLYDHRYELKRLNALLN